MPPKTIFKRPVVTKSISSDEGLRCVDIFRREDNSFGFEEYRTDPEANEGWFKIGFLGKLLSLRLKMRLLMKHARQSPG